MWPCAGTFILRGPPAIAGQVADVASPQSLAWRNRPLCDWQAARAVDWSLHPFHWAPRFSLTLGTASIARAGRRNCRFVSPTGSHSVEDDVARKKKKKKKGILYHVVSVVACSTPRPLVRMVRVVARGLSRDVHVHCSFQESACCPACSLEAAQLFPGGRVHLQGRPPRKHGIHASSRCRLSSGLRLRARIALHGRCLFPFVSQLNGWLASS